MILILYSIAYPAGDVNVGISSAVTVTLTVLSTHSFCTHSHRWLAHCCLCPLVLHIQAKIYKEEIRAMSGTKAVKPLLRTRHSACLCKFLMMITRHACVQGPHARACHPREEHLLPLMVAAGAARCSQAQVTFNEKLMGAKLSGFIWN